jgi:mediator of RNA polymerase II transcription subunit 18
MSSHLYEVALFGEFFSRDLKAILNRITLHSESSYPIHTREIVFEPFDAQHQRDTGTEPVILRAKKELTEPDAGWYAGVD